MSRLLVILDALHRWKKDVPEKFGLLAQSARYPIVTMLKHGSLPGFFCGFCQGGWMDSYALAMATRKALDIMGQV